MSPNGWVVNRRGGGGLITKKRLPNGGLIREGGKQRGNRDFTIKQQPD